MAKKRGSKKQKNKANSTRADSEQCSSSSENQTQLVNETNVDFAKNKATTVNENDKLNVKPEQQVKQATKSKRKTTSPRRILRKQEQINECIKKPTEKSNLNDIQITENLETRALPESSTPGQTKTLTGEDTRQIITKTKRKITSPLRLLRNQERVNKKQIEMTKSDETIDANVPLNLQSNVSQQSITKKEVKFAVCR